MSLNLKVKINLLVDPVLLFKHTEYALRVICKHKKKHKKLNNLTASATLLPKQLIYYANFDDHYVKSKFQF